MKDNPKTSWGGVADWYDELVETDGSYQKEVILPNLLRLVEPRDGMCVLDVACGQGFFSRAFAEKGATVVGVDVSPELIELARKGSQKNNPAGKALANLGNLIEYHVASADHLPFATVAAGEASKLFDAATIVLAIQNIERYAQTFAECARMLKKSGKLLLVLNHPAFRIPGQSSWGFDEKAASQYRRIDGYLGESASEIDMAPGANAKNSVTLSFHRPLQAYFKALGKAGFAVTRLEEWTSHKTSEKGPRQSAENRARREFPLFLLLEATKM